MLSGLGRRKTRKDRSCKKKASTRTHVVVLFMRTKFLVLVLDEAHRVDTKIQESYYKSQHTGSFSKRRKKRARCADSYELILGGDVTPIMKLVRRKLPYGNVVRLDSYHVSDRGPNFRPHSRLRPYHVESTGTRPISEVKQRRAWGVLRWVTTWES